MNKKIVILFAGVIILLALATWYFKVPKQGKQIENPANRMGKSQDSRPLDVEVKTVEPTKLPKDFPASIPLETGAKMVDNYNSTAEDGTYQATRVFESKKTLSQNFSLYEAFLKQDGWKLLATKDDEKLKVLSASKDNGMLQISMTQGTTGIVLVNISYTVK